MAFRRDLGENVDEGLVGSDQKSCTLDTHDLLAVHVLFLHHAKLIADFLVYISKECVRKVVFRPEFGLCLRRIARNAEDHGAGGLQLLERIAKAAGLDGAARSIGSGIKKENYGFAFKVREAYFFLLAGFQREVGDFGIEFHGDSPRMLNRLTISLHYGRAERGASLHRKRFSRIAGIVAVAIGLVFAVGALAQYPGQIAKKDKDTPELRAVAVLEWTGDLGKPKTSRLVPVTVFDGEQLQDGGVYLARPQPLAVDAGVEYILQKNGARLGLFDVMNAGQEQGSWVGFGSWKPTPVAKPKPAPVDQGKVDEEESDKPTLHRKHSGDASGDSGSSTGGQATAPDPDRPTLHKKSSNDDSGSGNSGSTTSSTSGSTSAPDPDRPTLHKQPDSSQTSGTDSNESSASNSDPDRPALKRGKQKQSADEGYVESVNTTDPDRPRLMRGKSADSSPDVTPTLMGLPSDMEQAVAVSDPKNRPEHPWNYSWSDPADELKMKAELEDIARSALGIKPQPAAAPKRITARAKTKPVPAAAPPPLAGAEFRVFELAYGSGATLVLTAHTDGPPTQQKFITLIAQPDLYGSLLVLFKSVTDGAHLDDTPRMRLVDAVDAMADNRGELLFELRGSTQRQFALYRVLRGTAKELFVTGGGAVTTAERN